MLLFVASRLLRAALTILFVMTFAFVVLRLSGDPALLIMSVDAPPEAIKAFRQAWGLDRPIWDQYLSYVAHAFTGDFGKSMRDGRPAIDLVIERVPATLAITLPALALKIGLGIPAGIYAALHRNSFADRLTMAVSVAGFTMPSFVLALLLVLVFSVNLGWLPPSGYVPLTEDWRQSLATTIMPAFVLGNAIAAILMRHTRSAMLTTLDQDYVRTARAKGLREFVVVLRHALRNALIPVVTLGALELGTMFSGAVLTEQVFSIPGFGKMIVDAVLLQQHAMHGERNGFHRYREGSPGCGDVVIMIIPDQPGSLAGGAGGQRIDIRCLTDAVAQDVVERDRATARRRNSIPMHQSSHAEDVQHRLIDSIGGQGAVAVEIGLAFKLKSPGQHREQVHMLAIRKFQ